MVNDLPYIPYRGACILIRHNNVQHLFVILNNPCADDNCLAVMLTSVKSNRPYDPSCVLETGDHPFIKKKTYILYRMADEIRARHITKMVEKGYFVPKEDAGKEMLAKIDAGLLSSNETRQRIIRYAASIGIT